jgi:hypothetical protein
LCCGLLAGVAAAATYKLTDGRTVVGELVEAGSDDASALINAGDGRYERVPWGQFSQEDLKTFLDKYKGNKKIVEAVDPFIEITQEEKAARTEVTINPIPPAVEQLQKGRLEPGGSVIASLFKSGLGIFLVLLIYGANIYAGVEIAVFRARPKGLVAGLAAIPVLGFLSNIIFLSMPTYVSSKVEDEMAAIEQARHEPTPTIAIPGQAEAAAAQEAVAAQSVAEGPKPEVYARGKFTFNKRFFETKFPNFFGMIRRDEDKSKVLLIKTGKREYSVQRITRITPSDVHITAADGGAAEITIHFSEIQEVVLKPHG